MGGCSAFSSGILSVRSVYCSKEVQADRVRIGWLDFDVHFAWGFPSMCNDFIFYCFGSKN
jgi:hypothetical protein